MDVSHEETRMQAIREFVNQGATLATYPQLNFETVVLDEEYRQEEDDEVLGNGDDETDDETYGRGAAVISSSAENHATEERSQKKARLTLRLSGGSSNSAAQNVPQVTSQQFDFGDSSLLQTAGNLSSMLEQIGLLQQEEGQWGDFGVDESSETGVSSRAQVSFGASLHDSSSSYKEMSHSAKMEWYDSNSHGEKLLKNPQDKNFRDLFGCRQGRTPDWRPDFTLWCVYHFFALFSLPFFQPFLT